jgi:hypothetical protein
MLQKTLLKKLKALKEIFDHLPILEKKNLQSLASLLLHKLEISLETCTMGKTLFDTLETSHFQQLKELSSTHFKLSMNRRTLFHTLSP